MNREIKGLTSEEVKKSLELYGDNSLKKQKQKTCWWCRAQILDVKNISASATVLHRK